MSARETIMAELLEQYLEELERNPNAPPPQGLDPQIVAAVQKMEAHFARSGPSPEFSASLGEQLQREATQIARAKKQSSRGVFGLPRWSFVGLGAAVVIVVGALLFL